MAKEIRERYRDVSFERVDNEIVVRLKYRDAYTAMRVYDQLATVEAPMSFEIVITKGKPLMGGEQDGDAKG